MELTPKTFIVGKLEAGTKATAGFTFHLNKEAPVGATARLSFMARDARNFSCSKTISLKVAAPVKFEVSPNYPNPFSAYTNIDMVLPVPMEVTVIIYDVLDRRVATVMDARQSAGARTLKWNPEGLASGVYFCRVVAKNQATDKQIEKVLKMMLIK